MSSTTPTTSRYIFGSRLASGGMGGLDLVIRREAHFRRVFVRKRIRRELSAEPGLREMFLDEARIAGMIRHPNVVPVVDVGEDEDGLFLVMELVEGVSLSQLMRELVAAERTLPIPVAAAIARGAATGLHAAHELTDERGQLLGLVHRDVSPQNILVGLDGIVRVTDFGISRSIGRLSQTSTGILKGKMGYLAPEVLQFEEIDRRADLFALGTVLYEMLAGTRLYGSDAQGARRVLKEPPPDVREVRPSVPPALARLIQKLLAKSPDERPASAEDVARELAAFAPEAASIELGTYVRDEAPRLVTEMRARVAAALAASGSGPGGDGAAAEASRPATAKLRLVTKPRRVAPASEAPHVAPSATATEIDPSAERVGALHASSAPIGGDPAEAWADPETRQIARSPSRDRDGRTRRGIATAVIVGGSLVIAVVAWAALSSTGAPAAGATTASTATTATAPASERDVPAAPVVALVGDERAVAPPVASAGQPTPAAASAEPESEPTGAAEEPAGGPPAARWRPRALRAPRARTSTSRAAATTSEPARTETRTEPASTVPAPAPGWDYE